jgi:16S rRNA (adenine1518-N6/adenine1519-N6)-dimethyltransferase
MPAYGKRRALGQHFLKEPRVTQLIADTTIDLLKEHRCRALLEIGPGRGAITEPLMNLMRELGPEFGSEFEKKAFVLSERDRELADYWKKRGVRVEEGDFLDLPEEKWKIATPLGVVSNLPYSAGTAILTRLARHHEEIPFMVLMFQAEVAERLRASVGTKAWGSLSIWIQNRWEVKKLCHVPPGAFSPPPDVQSEVVVLRARSEPLVSITDEKLWDSLLKTAFAHRRKMLRSCFRSSDLLRNALELSGLDGTKRGEALSWEEWAKLYGSAHAILKKQTE